MLDALLPGRPLPQALGQCPGDAAAAVLGGAFGSHVAHETDHGAHAHPHRRAYIERRHYREPVVYVPARYANGNGSTRVHCETKRKAYYKPKVVHRDDRTRVAYQPAKPKMKKVCRYLPVKQNTAASSYRSAG